MKRVYDPASAAGGARIGGGDSLRLAVAAKTEAASAVAKLKPDFELDMVGLVEILVHLAFWRANPYYGVIKLSARLVPLPDALQQMLDEALIPSMLRGEADGFRATLAADTDARAMLAAHHARLHAWFNEMTQSFFLGQHPSRRLLSLEQWLLHLRRCRALGTCEAPAVSDVTDDERVVGRAHRCALAPRAARLFFLEAAGHTHAGEAMVGFGQLNECIARCAASKYRDAPLAVAIDALSRSLLDPDEHPERELLAEVMRLRTPRLVGVCARPLRGQSDADHATWMATWRDVALSTLPHFPLWEWPLFLALQRRATPLLALFGRLATSAEPASGAGNARTPEKAADAETVADAMATAVSSVCSAAAVSAHPLADAAVVATASDAVRAAMASAVSATVARATTPEPRDVDAPSSSARVSRAALRELLEQCGAATDAVDTDEMLRYALNGARPPDDGPPDFVVAAAQAVLAAYPPALIRPASAPGSPPGSPLPSHRSAIRTPTPRRPAAERQGPERWPFTSPAQLTRSPAPIRPASASPTPRGLGAMVSSTPLGGCGCGSPALTHRSAAACVDQLCLPSIHQHPIVPNTTQEPWHCCVGEEGCCETPCPYVCLDCCWGVCHACLDLTVKRSSTGPLTVFERLHALHAEQARPRSPTHTDSPEPSPRPMMSARKPPPPAAAAVKAFVHLVPRDDGNGVYAAVGHRSLGLEVEVADSVSTGGPDGSPSYLAASPPILGESPPSRCAAGAGFDEATTGYLEDDEGLDFGAFCSFIVHASYLRKAGGRRVVGTAEAPVLPGCLHDFCDEFILAPSDASTDLVRRGR
jgi:hypothetical protein